MPSRFGKPHLLFQGKTMFKPGDFVVIQNTSPYDHNPYNNFGAVVEIVKYPFLRVRLNLFGANTQKTLHVAQVRHRRPEDRPV